MDVIVVATQCRNCQKIGAVKLFLPARKDQFPRPCDTCGLRYAYPVKEGALDKMEASFDAQQAMQRAERMEAVD